MDRVATDQWDAYVQRLTPIMQTKADPLQAKTNDIIRPESRLRRETVEEDPRLRFFFHLAHPGIIEVQNCHALRGRRQRLNQLRFSAGDGFLRTCSFRMNSANICH